MTAIETLERRIDELCKENEKLRQQVASIIDRSFRTADKMNCLEAENAKLRGARDVWQENDAKLRELVRDMMAFVEDDDACERCGHDAECVEAADGELVLPYEGRCLMLDLFADRMRELGIEVDE